MASAHWQGEVPITISPTTDDYYSIVEGSGSLSFSNFYIAEVYHSDGSGNLMECFYREEGFLDVNITGSRYIYPDVMPRYLITARFMSNTVVERSCEDGSYWRHEEDGLYGSRQFSLDEQNGYIDAYDDQNIHYLGELLDKTNL